MSLHKTSVPGSFCTNFYYCFQNKLKKLTCPINLLFDENRKMCNYAHKVSCLEIIHLLNSNSTTFHSSTLPNYSTQIDFLNQTENYNSTKFQYPITLSSNLSTYEDSKIYDVTLSTNYSSINNTNDDNLHVYTKSSIFTVSINDQTQISNEPSKSSEQIQTQEPYLNNSQSNFTDYINQTESIQLNENYSTTGYLNSPSLSSINLNNAFYSTKSYQNVNTSNHDLTQSINYTQNNNFTNSTSDYTSFNESHSSNIDVIKIPYNFTTSLSNFTDLSEYRENYTNFNTSKYASKNLYRTISTYNLSQENETTTTTTADFYSPDVSDSIIVDLVINSMLPIDYDLENLSTITQNIYSTAYETKTFNNSPNFMSTTPILEENISSTAASNTESKNEHEDDENESIEIEANNILESKLHELLNISDFKSFSLNSSELKIFIDISSDSSENKSEFSTKATTKISTVETILDEEKNYSNINSTKNYSNSLNLTDIELNIYDTIQPLSNFNNISSLITSLFSYNNNSNVANVKDKNEAENSEYDQYDSQNNTLSTNTKMWPLNSSESSTIINATTSNNLISESNNSTHHLIDWCEFVNLGIVPACQNGNFSIKSLNKSLLFLIYNYKNRSELS
jgi:hypothetical protein